MTDEERAELERVLIEVMNPSYEDSIQALAAARRKWCNEVLESAALVLADHGAENDIINGAVVKSLCHNIVIMVVGACIERIRGLKE